MGISNTDLNKSFSENRITGCVGKGLVNCKVVVVVEDIIDSGRTMHYLFDILRSRGPESVKLCALLDKPDRRVTEVDIDYTGFVIPDKFVVGYGLDYAQKYRNLPYIGVVTLDENN